jgi:hypothetical protein
MGPIIAVRKEKIETKITINIAATKLFDNLNFFDTKLTGILNAYDKINPIINGIAICPIIYKTDKNNPNTE